MIKMRNNLFETNSSSCHTISIKNKNDSVNYTLDDLIKAMKKYGFYKEKCSNGYKNINIFISFCINPHEGSDADVPLPFIGNDFTSKYEILCTYFYNRFNNYLLLKELYKKYNIHDDLLYLFRDSTASEKLSLIIMENYYAKISSVFYDNDVFGKLIMKIYNYEKKEDDMHVHKHMSFVRNGDLEEYCCNTLFGKLGIEESGIDALDPLSEEDIINLLLSDAVIEVSPNLYYD